MKKSLPLRLLLTFKNTEPSTLSLKSFRKRGGGGGGSPPKRGPGDGARGGGGGGGGGGGATSLKKANGNVPLEGVAFSRMD